MPGSKLKPLAAGKLPSTLDKRKLPDAKFSKGRYNCLNITQDRKAYIIEVTVISVLLKMILLVSNSQWEEYTAPDDALPMAYF